MSDVAFQAAKNLGIPDVRSVLRYIPPNQPVIIGYGVFPLVTLDVMPAMPVTVTLLDNPDVSFTCTYRREGKSKLFWLEVNQQPGSVCYRWTDPNGEVHAFIAHADDELDTADSRAETLERAAYLRKIWKFMHDHDQPLEVVKSVFQAVSNKHSLALCAFRLIEQLLAANNDNDQAVREEIKAHQTGDLTDRQLLRKLKLAGATNTAPETVRAILRGATRVLNYREQ